MGRWALSYATILQRYRKFFQENGAGRLALFFVAATLFVFVIAGKNVTAEVLFQSPQSPPAEPEPTAPPPPPEPTPLPPPSPTPAPVEVEPAPQESIQVEPTEAPPPTEELLPAAEEAAIEQQAVEPTVTPPPTAAPAAEPELQAEVAPVELEPQPIERSRGQEETVAETEAGRNFILDQAELIDTVAISGAYLWLCCGFGLLLMAPLSLLLLYVRGRSRVLQDEDF